MVFVAVNFTLVPVIIAPEGLAAMVTLATILAFTVIVMELDVAGDPVIQVAFDVITHVIISPFASVADVYVEFVAPEIADPFFLHWYVGALPPLVGVAVNFTLVTEQTAPEGLTPILILATKTG